MTTPGTMREECSESFVAVRCRVETLDIYVHRKRIARALTSLKAELAGTVLDVGCGLQPYRRLLTGPLSRVTRYVGVDLPQQYLRFADVCWDGHRLPFGDATIDCALATEVLEHCPNPSELMAEVHRVLLPAGWLALTVPFLWPLHCVPNDEFRFTPFALERLLNEVGFEVVELKALGGWDASLAQLLGLWVRRRLRPGARVRLARALLSVAALPIVWSLERRDSHDSVPFKESQMITGVFARARRAAAGRS